MGDVRGLVGGLGSSGFCSSDGSSSPTTSARGAHAGGGGRGCGRRSSCWKDLAWRARPWSAWKCLFAHCRGWGWAARSVPGQAPSPELTPEPALQKLATGLQDTILPGSACSDLSWGAGQGVEASLSCPFGLRALEPSPPSCGHHIPSLFNPSGLRAFLRRSCSSLPQGLCTCRILFGMHFPLLTSECHF